MGTWRVLWDTQPAQPAPTRNPHVPTLIFTAPGVKAWAWRGTSGVESPQLPWRGQLCRFPPFLAHLPCCLTVFQANYPVLLRARAMWQLAAAPTPRNDLGCSEDSGSLSASQASPEADKDPPAGGTRSTSSLAAISALPAPGALTSSSVLRLTVTSTRTPQHCLPAETHSFRLGNLSPAVFHPSFAAEQP